MAGQDKGPEQVESLKPSLPKTEFRCRVYDERLYPKLYSPSRPVPVPLRIEEDQRKGGTETEQDPRGLSGDPSEGHTQLSSPLHGVCSRLVSEGTHGAQCRLCKGTAYTVDRQPTPSLRFPNASPARPCAA